MKTYLKLTLLTSLFLLLQTGIPYSSSNNNFTDSATGMEFVFVEGGCYQMGDNFGDGSVDEKPVHEVCLDDFYIGKYEVTWGEYEKVTGPHLPHMKKGDNYPVMAVSWFEAQDFIRLLNDKTSEKFRLPTEAEWEYAARSGGKNEKFAGSASPDSVAWYGGNSDWNPHRVGEKLPNGLGIYDMSGNLKEWCQDWYNMNYYQISPKNNPKGPSTGLRRIARGGHYKRIEEQVRTSYRDGDLPDDQKVRISFRLVLPVKID